MRLQIALASLTLLAMLGMRQAQGTELNNGRIDVELATSADGLVTTDADRVDSISWINSAGVSTGNLAANWDYQVCGDLDYYFGDSYGEVEGSQLFVVFGGVLSTWRDIEPGFSGVAKTTGHTSCSRQWSAVAATHYTLSSRAAFANTLRIQRKFTFLPHVKTQDSNIRTYVPRLSLPIYYTVLLPETDGAIHTFNAETCGSACDLPNWSGTWFADDDGHGDGMVMIRDASSTWPAVVAMDNDGGGDSNATSISLVEPAGGWTGTITETQWLCFYDRKTWPAASQAAGELPKGCKVPMAGGVRR